MFLARPTVNIELHVEVLLLESFPFGNHVPTPDPRFHRALLDRTTYRMSTVPRYVGSGTKYSTLSTVLEAVLSSSFLLSLLLSYLSSHLLSYHTDLWTAARAAYRRWPPSLASRTSQLLPSFSTTPHDRAPTSLCRALEKRKMSPIYLGFPIVRKIELLSCK